MLDVRRVNALCLLTSWLKFSGVPRDEKKGQSLQTRFSDSCKSGEKFEGDWGGVGVMINGVSLGLVSIVYAHQNA